MNIEFLEDASEDCPLVRIYGTDPIEFSAFHSVAQRLALVQENSFMLQELARFHAVSGCTLKLLSCLHDVGANRIGRSEDFEWRLTPKKWSVIAGLIEPFFVESRDGIYQWLSGKEARHGLNVGTISVLLINSDTGIW